VDSDIQNVIAGMKFDVFEFSNAQTEISFGFLPFLKCIWLKSRPHAPQEGRMPLWQGGLGGCRVFGRVGATLGGNRVPAFFFWGLGARAWLRRLGGTASRRLEVLGYVQCYGGLVRLSLLFPSVFCDFGDFCGFG